MPLAYELKMADGELIIQSMFTSKIENISSTSTPLSRQPPNHDGHEINWDVMILTIFICLLLIGVILCLWRQSRHALGTSTGDVHPAPAHIVLPLTRTNLALTQFSRNLSIEWNLSTTSLTTPLNSGEKNKTAEYVIEPQFYIDQMDISSKDDCNNNVVNPVGNISKHIMIPTNFSHPLGYGNCISGKLDPSKVYISNSFSIGSEKISSSDNHTSATTNPTQQGSSNVSSNKGHIWTTDVPCLRINNTAWPLTSIGQAKKLTMSEPSVAIHTTDPYHPPNNTPVTTTNTSATSSIDSRIINYSGGNIFYPVYATVPEGASNNMDTSSPIIVAPKTTPSASTTTKQSDASATVNFQDLSSPRICDISVALSSGTQRGGWTYNQLYGQFSLKEAHCCVSAPVLMNINSNNTSLQNTYFSSNSTSEHNPDPNTSNTSMIPLIGSSRDISEQPSATTSHNTSMYPNVGSQESSHFNSKNSSLVAIATGGMLTEGMQSSQMHMIGESTCTQQSSSTSSIAFPVVVYQPAYLTRPVLAKTKYWL